MFILLLLTLSVGGAWAHDVSAAETARLRGFVQGITGSGWAGAVLLAGGAVALGALHGLEPGHSKTMMSAFIVAVRGTVRQAVLLGTAATVSHTAVIWGLVLPVLLFGGTLDLARSGPYFQVASAVLVILMAGWMACRAAGGKLFAAARSGHEHDHDPFDGHAHSHAHPREEYDHDQDRAFPARAHLDAHARAHADDLRQRLASGPVTNWQIVMFGLSGGLLPCSAAITILLLCLQLQRPVLGLVLVASFSLGLALTMIAAGALAALGARHVARRWRGFDGVARHATFASCGIVLCIGIYMLAQGLGALA